MAENRAASATGYRPIKSKTTAYGSTDDICFHSTSILSEDGGHPDDSGEHGQKARPRVRKKSGDERPLSMGDPDTQFHVDDDSPRIKLLPGHQQKQSLHRRPQPHDAAQQTQHGQQAPLGQEKQIKQGQLIQPGQEQQQQVGQGQPIPPGQEQQIQQVGGAPVEQLDPIQPPPYQRGKLCKIFDICLIGVPAALLLACIGLLIYVGYMGDHVQLNDDIWFSSTENYSLNDNHLHRYASEVCIKELSQEHQDDLDDNQVTVMLAKKPCKDAPLKKALRKINKSFTSDSSPNARLYFYWISKTSVSFEVNITSDTKVGHLTVYILRTELQEKECVHHSKPTGNDEYFVFNFDGSSTSNVNCTQENNTIVCWSSPVVISKTQHYHVCMLFSSGSIDKESVTVTYNLIANEVTYDLTDTCESVQCHLNESNCCISYNSFFDSSCVFLKNSAIGNDNQAVELPVPLTITSKKRWTAVKYLAIPTSVLFLLCVAASVYVITKLRYRKRHPNREDYMKLTDAARTCFCS